MVSQFPFERIAIGDGMLLGGDVLEPGACIQRVVEALLHSPLGIEFLWKRCWDHLFRFFQKSVASHCLLPYQPGEWHSQRLWSLLVFRHGHSRIWIVTICRLTPACSGLEPAIGITLFS